MGEPGKDEEVILFMSARQQALQCTILNKHMEHGVKNTVS